MLSADFRQASVSKIVSILQVRDVFFFQAAPCPALLGERLQALHLNVNVGLERLLAVMDLIYDVCNVYVLYDCFFFFVSNVQDTALACFENATASCEVLCTVSFHLRPVCMMVKLCFKSTFAKHNQSPIQHASQTRVYTVYIYIDF